MQRPILPAHARATGQAATSSVTVRRCRWPVRTADVTPDGVDGDRIEPDIGGSDAGQGRPSRLQGGAGGDDIVDDEDVGALQAGASPERHPVEAFPTGPTRLGVVVITPIEQPPRRHAQLPSDVPGDEFTLVETPGPSARRARRRPGDEVEAEVVTVRHDRVDDQAGEMAGDLTSVPVLQAEHHVAGATGEGHAAWIPSTSGPWPRAERGRIGR